MANAQIIDVVSAKGGVGKTTLATLLAGELALRSHRVLLVALDFNNPSMSSYFLSETTEDVAAHRSSAYLLEHPKNDYNTAVWHFLLDPDAMGPDHTPRYNRDALYAAAKVRRWQFGAGLLDIIPDHDYLAEVAQRLPQSQAIGNAQLHLRTALEPARKNYDYIIIDTPPARLDREIIARNAALAADAFVLPVFPTMLALDAVRKDYARIREHNEKRALFDLPPAKIAAVVAQKIMPDKDTHQQVMTSLRNSRNLSPFLCPVTLPNDDYLEDAQFASDLYQMYRPDGPVVDKFPLVTNFILEGLTQ